MLAVAGALAVRRWAVTFFTVAALCQPGWWPWAATLPFGLYEELWLIPGMNLQRAPARFTLITTLRWRCWRRSAPTGWPAAPGPSVCRRRLPAPPAGAFAALVLVGLGVVVLHLVIWRAWLQTDRPWAMEALTATYLRLAQDPLQTLEPLDVVLWPRIVAEPGQPEDGPAAGRCSALFAVLLLVWRELPAPRRLWRGLLVLLVVVDLVGLRQRLPSAGRRRALGDVGPAGAVLVENAGPWRVLTRRRGRARLSRTSCCRRTCRRRRATARSSSNATAGTPRL